MDSSQPFLVGRWRVEAKLNTISKDGQDIILVPKVMQLLQALCDTPGEPVSQGRLFELLWPGQVVSDASLYQAVAQLRKALGDTRKNKTYIERVSGRGYRLIAPVRPATINSDSVRSRRLRRVLVAGVLVLILAVFGYGVTRWLVTEQQENHHAKLLTIDQISSLTFARLKIEESPLLENNPTVNALNDVLLTQLMHIDGMLIISQDPEPHQVNTQAILQGKIVEQDGDIRLYLQLLDVSTQQVIWAKMFSGSVADLFGFQDAVVDDLLRLLKRQQPVKAFTESVANRHAFDQYLLARFLWQKRNQKALEQAREILETLRAENQLFPMAAVALCETYHFLYIYSDWPLEKALRLCEPLLDKALRESPQLGQALAAKAMLLSSRGNNVSADKLFQRALTIAPNYAMAYAWYGNFVRNLGQYDKALKLSQKAFELDPLSPIINRGLAYSYLNARKPIKAEYFYRRAITLEPDYADLPVSDLDFFELTSARAKAFLTWAKEKPLMLERHPNHQLTQAQVWLALGEYEKVEATLEKFKFEETNPAFTYYVKASLFIALEDYDGALQAIEARRQLQENLPGFDSIYYQLLVATGRYQMAQDIFLAYFSDFNSPQVDITQDNVSRAIDYFKLLASQGQAKIWEDNARIIDQLIDTAPEYNLTHAEWHLLRDKPEKARQIVDAMMASGWLPDTNRDPFAKSRMAQVYIAVGAGKEKFNQYLTANIQQVIAK